MSKFCLLLIAVIFSFLVNGQNKKDRLFVNLGGGPSYSLFYRSGGWVRNFGPPNFNNITERRIAWAFSHFAEMEWRLKNPRWSLRAGYSSHRFSPAFRTAGQTPNGTAFFIDTREEDRYTYYQVVLHYAFIQVGRSRVEFGTGFYIQDNRRQNIDYLELQSGPFATGPTFTISDYKSQEAGFPFNLDYTWKLKNENGIGVRLNMNYTQSVQTFEHLACQLYFKGRIF